MANVLGDLFTDIAAAIKEKSGNNATMKPTEFPDRIRNIEADSSSYNLKLAEMMMKRDPEDFSDDEKVLSLRSFKLSDGLTLASLQSYSFAGFEDVEYMEFTDVAWVQKDAFCGCPKLKVLDITVPWTLWTAINFGGESLNGCTGLESIIVRGGAEGLTGVYFMKEQIYNDNNVVTGVSKATDGSSNNFYVYVPRDYYDTVISNINSSYHCVGADRFRVLEDFPELDHWNDTYTVKFYDGDVLVDTKTVKYGATATTSYKKDGYSITWEPSNVNITEDTNCYAQLTEIVSE